MNSGFLPLSLGFLLLLAGSCSRSVPVIDAGLQGATLVNNVSNIRIRSFAEDSEGYIWMGTAQSGVLRFDGKQFIHYQASSGENSLSANVVLSMNVDSDGELWIGTQQGINRYDISSHTFFRPFANETNSYVLSVLEDRLKNIYYITYAAVMRYDAASDSFVRVLSINPVTYIWRPTGFFDRSNHFWLNVDNHVFHYDNSFYLVEQFDLPSVPRSVLFDDDGLINIFLDSKSLVLDTRSSQLSDQKSESTPVASLSPLLRYSSFTDSHKNLWTSLPDGGFKVTSAAQPVEEDGFITEFLHEHTIGSTASRGNYYWAIVDGSHILTYDISRKAVISLQSLQDDLNCSLRSPTIKCAPDGRILLSGLAESACTAVVQKDGTLSFECKYVMGNRFVATIDNRGDLWCTTPGGSVFRAPKPGTGEKEIQISEYVVSLENPRSFPDMIETLKNGKILILQTDNPVYVFDPISGKNRVLKLKDNDIQIYYSAYLEEENGLIWIGSSDSGLFLYNSYEDTLEHIDMFGNQGISKIHKDAWGNTLFAFNDASIYRLNNSDTSEFSLVWRNPEDFSSIQSTICLPDKRIVILGGAEIVILPNRLQEGRKKLDTPISITLTSGRNVLTTFLAGDNDKKATHLWARKNLADLRLHLSVLDYANDNIYNFKYSVNSRADSYQSSINQPDIPIYGLHYGRNHIRFIVEETLNPTSSEPYSVYLHIRRPASFYIFTLLAIALLLTLTAIVIYAQNKEKEAEKERRERLFQEEVNVKNMDFFANLSHEFRTPLTLINGAASCISEQDILSKEGERSISIIRKGTNRLLKLVNQLLDFNKLDHGMMSLSVAMTNISDIVFQVVDSFSIGAMQKSISLILEGCDSPRLGWLDADVLEKILYNLCSNALKFTPPGGTIRVEVSEPTEGRLHVSVADSGIGIQEDLIGSLFDRFVQGQSANKAGGTGIGLYYAKSLTVLHKGSIQVENIMEDGTVVGARFSLDLPTDRASYNDEELAPEKKTTPVLVGGSDKNDYVAEIQNGVPDKNKPTILLIDDDYEFVYFLESQLSHHYNVVFRFDAMSGYSCIESSCPDLIITDVMMLEMDGLQLCKMIKENLDICHIPVIILTAKTTISDQVESLNIGADAYVAKPFNPEYLQALIKSLLDNRARIRKILNVSTSVPTEKEENISARDRGFMNKLYDLMEKRILDSEIDINSIADEMGISRSKLFYKIKSLTGQTPNDFFNVYRMNYAAKLLKGGKYKISAVANMVGFNSSSHFSTLFKKQFGVSPKDYYEEA